MLVVSPVTPMRRDYEIEFRRVDGRIVGVATCSQCDWGACDIGDDQDVVDRTLSRSVVEHALRAHAQMFFSWKARQHVD
jgi:hypothetical protein